MARWKKVLAGLVIAYVLIWYTDSVWEYIPESNPSLAIPSSPNYEGTENPSETSVNEIEPACSFLKMSLIADRAILDGQNDDAAELNKRLALDDPAYADALSDYPELRWGITLGDNWEQHALRMESMYQKASKLVTEDLEFSETLKDSAFVWYKRLVLRQTPPGVTKGQRGEEQIALDTREGNTNRPLIKKVCKFTDSALLP